MATETNETLKAWRQYLESRKRPFELGLIQESRPEAPPDAVDALSADVRVFAYERMTGFREALSAAIAAAQHPLVVFCTCDKQYQPPDLDGMLKVIDNVDLVVGYRTGGQPPLWRALLDLFSTLFCRIVLGIPLEPRRCWLGGAGWGRRWVARWVFGLRVLDPECPFRLARREILKKWPFQSSGPFVQVEILAKANHLTCLLAEEGVSWTPPTVVASDAITFGEDAWRIFRSPDFGVYQETPPPQILPTPPS